MLRRFAPILALVMLSACIPGATTSPTVVVPTTAPTAVATTQPTVPPTAPSNPTAVTIIEPTSTPTVAARDELAVLAAAQPQQRDQTAIAEAFSGQDYPEVARTTPLDVQVGDVEEFWVSDAANNTNYQISARLRYAGPVVLMYVDTSLDSEVAQDDIERSARRFEEEIYPRNRAVFGEESSPGIDGDVRLTVLNTTVRGAGGYFSSVDGVTRAVNRFSNERDMFVIGIDSYPIGGDNYVSTLAHEFQHMIEWNVARTSPTWFNEGMSTLAEDLYGFDDPFQVLSHIESPDIQLTTWGSDSAQTGRHYGTSRAFMRYIYNQYGGETAINTLVQANAGENLDAFVQVAQVGRPDITQFSDITADWAVANLVDDDQISDGRYSYPNLPGTVQPEYVFGSGQATVSQFGADYLALPTGPSALTFDGADTIELVGALPESGSYAWWSNSADDSVQTLTRSFDLSSVSAATLNFSTWYEIERYFDYAFVSVSADNGTTWTTLAASTSTNEDPQGANLGNGITGVSGSPGAEIDEGIDGSWINEQVDLSPYAGRQVLVRFWMISDAALNGAGMLIDNISIPELNYNDDVETGDGSWEAVGFARTTGGLPQQWELRLVREGANGTTVEDIATDQAGRAAVVLQAGERGTLVVMASTPFTQETAGYSYRVESR